MDFLELDPSEMGSFAMLDDAFWERELDLDLHDQENPENEASCSETKSLTNVNKPLFIELDDNEKENFIEKIKNKNTLRKTESSMRQFDRFLKQTPRNETRDIYDIMPAELDNYIGSFLLSIRKADGSEYEPDTLTSYHRGIDRYLREKKYQYSIVTDREFAASRAVLASKRKELKGKGKGNRPKASEPISSDESAILRERGIIGVNSPESLLNTLWLKNTTLFGIRGCSENHSLRWGGY